jgi:hypothetical protein
MSLLEVGRKADRRRRLVNVGGVGVVTAGLPLTALADVAMAARAHADPISEMLDNMQSSTNLADQLFTFATGYYASGETLLGLNFDLTAIDNLLIGPSQNFVVDMTDILTNEPVSAFLAIDTLPSPVPTDLADGLAAVQDWVGLA